MAEVEAGAATTFSTVPVPLGTADKTLPDASKVLSGLEEVCSAAALVLSGVAGVFAALEKVLSAVDQTLDATDKVWSGAAKVLSGVKAGDAAAEKVLSEADKVLAEADKVWSATDKVLAGAEKVCAALEKVTATASKTRCALSKATATLAEEIGDGDKASGGMAAILSAAPKSDNLDDPAFCTRHFPGHRAGKVPHPARGIFPGTGGLSFAPDFGFTPADFILRPSTRTMKAAQKSSTAPGATPTRLAVVDAQGSIRGFFRDFLSRRQDYEFVAEGRTAEDALRLCREFEPHVLVIELLPGEPGTAQVIATLRAEGLPTRTLIFTNSDNEFALVEASRTNPHGMVHKDESFPAVWVALEMVARGGCSISPRMRGMLDRALARNPEGEFTPREIEVWKMTAEGMVNKEIADKLGVAPKTTEHNRSTLMEKLGVHDIASLTRAAVRKGLVR